MAEYLNKVTFAAVIGCGLLRPQFGGQFFLHHIDDFRDLLIDFLAAERAVGLAICQRDGYGFFAIARLFAAICRNVIYAAARRLGNCGDCLGNLPPYNIFTQHKRQIAFDGRKLRQRLVETLFSGDGEQHIKVDCRHHNRSLQAVKIEHVFGRKSDNTKGRTVETEFGARALLKTFRDCLGGGKAGRADALHRLEAVGAALTDPK